MNGPLPSPFYSTHRFRLRALKVKTLQVALEHLENYSFVFIYIRIFV